MNEHARSHGTPRDPHTAVRRALLWWFQTPADAHVSINFAIDFRAARAYLAALEDGDGPRVTVQHLLVAAIGRTLQAHPLANAQVVSNRIVMRDRVGVAMPVNLLGHAGGSKRELGVAVVRDAGKQTLRQVAAATRTEVHTEREGQSTNRIVGALTRLAEAVPQPLFFRTMDAVERLNRLPPARERLFEALPVTTLLSNAGAPFAQQPGVLFRGGALSPPQRLAHVGTIWGVSTVQDEVVAVDGRPEVRPMLPLLMLFDHRLIDGVAAGRVALHFAAILQDPAGEFGADGRRPGG